MSTLFNLTSRQNILICVRYSWIFLFLNLSLLQFPLYGQTILLDFPFNSNTDPTTNTLNGSFTAIGTSPIWYGGGRTPPSSYVGDCGFASPSAIYADDWDYADAYRFVFHTMAQYTNYKWSFCCITNNPNHNGVTKFGTMEARASYDNGVHWYYFNSGWDTPGVPGVWAPVNGWDNAWQQLPASFENQPEVIFEIFKMNNAAHSSDYFAIDNFRIFGDACPVPNVGAITGSNIACSGSTNTYQVTAVANATSYEWAVPAGATIIADNDTSISVSWPTGAVSGNVCCTASNDCGTSPQSCLGVTFTPVPQAPALISGNDTVCVGDIVVYTATSALDATSYSWTIPASAQITGDSSTNTITLQWINPGATHIYAKGNNNCGTGAGTSLDIYVLPEGEGICTSSTENGIETTSIRYFPNPVTDILQLNIFSWEHDWVLDIINTNGQIILSKILSNTNPPDFFTTINLTDLPAGYYTSRVLSGKTAYWFSILKF